MGGLDIKEIVVDENLITSRGPYGLPAFCKEIIKFFERKRAR